MKYDILKPFRGYLQDNLGNKNTADRYYFSVVKLFKDLQFNSLSEIKVDVLEDRISKVKTKNELSALKNGLIHLEKFDSELRIPDHQFFRNTSIRKRNWRKKPRKII